MFNDFLSAKKGGKESLETDSSAFQLESVSALSDRDIAIIGIDCRVGGADTLADFWNGLELERDFIRPYPIARAADAGVFSLGGREFYPAAYLEHVDQFDHDFFQLSYNEACGIDPNQRQLLQSSWRAFEDAGYGKSALAGSKVGIFVGFNSDFDPTYREYVGQIAPESQESLSAAGNIQSVLASRLAYLLDLKGPSLVVDTACSSCLTALHLACQSLHRGECQMALLGGVKVRLLPREAENELGLRSASGRCKTFDERSDGIGSGEGVISLILKPLDDAERDGDNIYALVKASGINQDGRSVGITAPSADAQQQLIREVLESADIDPATIGLYEAHGTGTKLGDPVELSAIDKAYRTFTDKRQFCAIGAVKSNTGHLDHAAAMVGLVKIVMALKHQYLPATLHFHSPNPEFDFIDSPVYVNETGGHWPALETPRRAALSAFGLSGTNAHAIFEEYLSSVGESADECKGVEQNQFWLPFSAASLSVLEQVVADFLVQLASPVFSPSLADVAYTLSCGRTHHAYRLMVGAVDLADLRKQLQQCRGAIAESPLYGYHKVVPSSKKGRIPGEHSEAEMRYITGQAARLVETGKRDEAQLAALYRQGADVDWQTYYCAGEYRRIALPTYPFAAKRCWVPFTGGARHAGLEEVEHPLVDTILARSYDRIIFTTRFDVDKHWVLNEHLIDGNYIVPGTTYVEMASAMAVRYLGYDTVEMQNVIFLQPVIVAPQQPRDIQLVLISENEKARFVVTGLQDGEWIIYAQGGLLPDISVAAEINLPQGSQLASFDTVTEAQINQQTISDVGPRWDSLKHARRHQDQVFGEFSLPLRFREEVAGYHIHPALMDHCVNIANGLAGKATYLPFSYRSIQIYRPLPAEFSALLIMKKGEESAPETVKYDISIVSLDGKPVMAIRDYVIKQYKQNFRNGPEPGFITSLVPAPEIDGEAMLQQQIVLLDSTGMQVGGVAAELAERLAKNNRVQVFTDMGKEVWEAIQVADRVILYPGAEATELSQTALTLFRFAKGVALSHRKHPLQLTIVAHNGYAKGDGEALISPAVHAMYAMAKVVSQELHNVSVSCLDVPSEVEVADILPLVTCHSPGYQVRIWRRNGCYEPQLQQRQAAGSPLEPLNREGGCYVISGASGALAEVAASVLAAKASSHLCLLSRTGLDDGTTKAHSLQQHIAKLKAAGATVEYHALNVADAVRVEPVLANLRRQYGAINGVLHTAGQAGDGFMFRKEEAEFSQVIRAKVAGAEVLDRLTREDSLDFFILYSSVTAVFAGMGQSDYTYANAWLDAVAERRRQQGLPALAVQWPAWSETGMAVEMQAKLDGFVAPLTTRQGQAVLEHVIENCEQGTVMPGQLNPDFDGDEQSLPVVLGFTPTEKIAVAGTVAEGTVVLTGNQGGNSDLIAQSVAEVWASVLGLGEVDLSDSFFNLGGDSILAVKVIQMIEQKFGSIIDVTDIFTYPTVSQLADHIRSQTHPLQTEAIEDNRDFDLDTLLSQLESGDISVEEANAKSIN
ncbi:beta-ketoacyl synthase N-terminal-like domain-containing protein [Photobacterium sp. DNB22_13_2]